MVGFAYLNMDTKLSKLLITYNENLFMEKVAYLVVK